MVDLNRPSQFGDVDSAHMLARIVELPQQIRDAWAQGSALDLPAGHKGAAHIVICGMGGSAIGGDLTRVLAEAESRVPIVVVRGYELPAFVSKDSLVIISSFSGATEETLSACEAALQRGSRVMAITTGGPLATRARQAGFPLVHFSFSGQPREAIGYSTLLMLAALCRLEYLADRGDDVTEAAALLERMVGELGPDAPAEQNTAKRIALKSFGKLGLVYGGGLMGEVARRWKGQFNENAKHWAFFEQLPELNHNAVLGYQFPTDLAAKVLVIMVSSDLNHPRIKLRETITTEVLGRWGVQTELVLAEGQTALQHVLSASYVGDYVSYYLALLNDVDPSDIDTINFLKARLAHAGLSPQGNGKN